VGVPSGTVTFLFTDIEGSTRLWESSREGMRVALARHDEIVRAGITSHGGHVFATGGDGLAAAFGRAGDGVSAAVATQARLSEEPWPDGVSIRVRMGLHTGEVEERAGDYFGPAVNRAARLTAVAHGGQVVCSAVTAGLVDGGAVAVHSLGEHRLRDLASPEVVFQVGEGSFPRLRSVDAVPTNLPTVRTELIGRTTELDELAKLVEGERLVTLTGVGGVGKTRLALGIAAAVAPGFADGAWIVELAPAASIAEVVGATAAALGTPLSELDAVVSYLAGRRTLLVLDNCEHVLAEAAELVDAVLEVAPEVHVVVTSREQLALPGEQVRRVESLAVPAVDATVDEAAVAAAAQLFVDRARAVSAGFVLTDTNVDAVGSICRHLDGIPLAIELAAAQVRAMRPAEIEARLGERFRLLSAGSRRAHDRHRTLLAAISWSYDLLSDEEKLVFRRLAVFPSTFDLTAAEEVAGDGDLDVLDATVRLVDRSLVAHEPDTGRYRLLETLRQYAADRLADTGETDLATERHARYFTALALRLSPHLEDARYGVALGALTTELDNLRATIEWQAEQGRWRELAEVVLGLWHFAFQVGPAVGQDWFAHLFAHQQELDGQVLVDLLGQSAWLAFSNGVDAALARRNAQHSINVADEHGHGQSPWAWATSGAMALMNPSEDALSRFQRGLAAADARDDELAAITITGFLGMAHGRRGEDAQAAAALSESLRRAELYGHPVAVQAAVQMAVSRYLFSGNEPDLEAASSILARHDVRIDDAMAMFADGLYGATLVALGRGGAVERLVRSARLADRRGSVMATDMALTFLAIAAGRQGHGAEAATLAGYAAAHRAPDLFLHSPSIQWVDAALAKALSDVPDLDGREAAGAIASRSQIMALITQLATDLDDR
jgi:predicted ATPase/class 3 adenylate cyclase